MFCKALLNFFNKLNFECLKRKKKNRDSFLKMKTLNGTAERSSIFPFTPT